MKFSFLSTINTVLELSFQLAKTNFKLRNEGSYLGIFWYLLEPLVFFLILLLVGDMLNQNTIPYYPIYLFIGLIMFNFFTTTTSHASQAIIDNAGYIKNIKINPELFVISGVTQFIFSHIFEFILIVLLGIYLKINILWFFGYIFIFFLFVLFTLGVSFILSVWSVYMIDLKNIWNVCTRLLWFITPIFYMLPQDGILKAVSRFNPMYHFINVTRDVLIFHTINIGTFALAFMSSFFVFAIGLFIFERSKSIIAEKI